MNETYAHVIGNVVADPDERRTQTGAPFTTFRIASTVRRPTKDGHYEDGPTSFYNVVAFRQLALNTVSSIKRGDPVAIYGRQRVNQFTREDGSTGTSVEIDALTVGHDLSRGTTTFVKGTRPKVDPGDRLSDPNVRSATQGWSSDYTTSEDAGAHGLEEEGSDADAVGAHPVGTNGDAPVAGGANAVAPVALVIDPSKPTVAKRRAS